MKYRKRPIVIEAEQWFPGKEIEGLIYSDDGKMAFIDTLEGMMTVVPSDWIITGIKGEKYPCKDDIFKITYEKDIFDESNH